LRAQLQLRPLARRLPLPLVQRQTELQLLLQRRVLRRELLQGLAQLPILALRRGENMLSVIRKFLAFRILNLREIAVKKMTKLLTTFFAIALSTAISGADNNRETSTFIETYDDGTDVGLWHCSVNAPRILEASGGNPGAYIQQGGFSTSVPTWASISTRFQPGVSDPYKIDSIYTGDWTSLGVTSIAADLNVIQVATWATDRAVTLELLQMDETGFNVNYDATYTLPDLPDPPVGWQTYSFPVNANSPTIPEGWVFTRGDGTPGTDAEWSVFLQRIDLTSVGFYKPDLLIPVSAPGYSGSTTLKSTFRQARRQPRRRLQRLAPHRPGRGRPLPPRVLRRE
jgi:hypothetical protein